MKKVLNIILSMVLCVTLAACNNNPTANTKDTNENSLLTASPGAPAAASDTLSKSDNPVNNPDDMYHAYFTALENLIKNHIIPDGTDVEEQLGDMSENMFAVHDVDNDGKEELILLYSTTITAGMAGYVFAYDSKAGVLQTQLYEYPALAFYNNGIVKALWSHNQGRAGDHFWPYNLYQYVPESDKYVLVGMVDAWDKNYAETDDQNNPFPGDIDKSGTGIVYYIMEDGQDDDTHPVDASEYNEWVGAHIGDALEIQIQYLDLTEENLSRIKNRL
ncbi:MAG TPA: hypothetical protein DEB10_11665 [Ruminococcaceae bacterium]|jgi:hypothetical protein|nr:hypothetical protein [Oscillospiraceae bacterium]